MTTWQPARLAVRGRRALLRRADWRHPVVLATALSALLHILWALFLAKDSGDMAAQYAWTEFIRAHPSASYNLSWYGGMHPASYSILSPYIMAGLGVRTTAVLAGTASATVAGMLVMRAKVKRPMLPVLWTTFALWCDVVSGRVTFALGMLFALVATALLYPEERAIRGRGSRRTAATLMAALATMCSPVAGLFLLVVAGALFLTERRKDAYMLAVAPPLVVAATSLLFPFYGVQPFAWYFAIIPLVVSVAIGYVVPRSWRAVYLGTWVYGAGVVLTYIIPSPIGSNVERLALLFGGTVLLIVAMGGAWGNRRTSVLWMAFVAAAIWQITTPIVDQVTTAAVSASAHHAGPLISELRSLHADRGRVEVVPLRLALGGVGPVAVRQPGPRLEPAGRRGAQPALLRRHAHRRHLPRLAAALERQLRRAAAGPAGRRGRRRGEDRGRRAELAAAGVAGRAVASSTPSPGRSRWPTRPPW